MSEEAKKPGKSFQRHTVTAALPYANGGLHIGHLAGVYIPADIYVRYLRSCGRDVLFVCGSDEHGVAITIQARKEGISPRALVDKNHKLLRQAFMAFQISTDIYSRTSAPVHHETAQEFFTRFHEMGALETRTNEQFYDAEANMFLADRYIVGTCPKCGYDQAYGDQCENCGSSLSALELINPRSALTGNVPELRETTHWYLPLDKYQKQIEQYILEEHSDWKPNVFGQCKSWLNEGLQPRAITRDMEWGVPVPLAEADGKVLYVWFDAPIGYISASKHWAQERAEAFGGTFHKDDWKKYWQSPDAKLVHFIGKDNIVFHCIIFPALLMNHGDYYPADQVPANEFLNLEGKKLSTSRNWAVWAHEFAEEHPELIDVMRYTLCANMPETKDSDFTWKDFQARNNNELGDIPGNYFNRALTLAHKYYDGATPQPGEFEDADQTLLAEIAKTGRRAGAAIEHYRFREALNEVMNLARAGNKYMADMQPWHLIKTDPERVKTVVYVSLQVCAGLSLMFSPFLPAKAGRMQELLNFKPYGWATLDNSSLIPAGQAVQKPEILFPRLEDSFVEAQTQKLEAARQAAEPAPSADPIKETIEFDQFAGIDLRVGTITAAEKVKKADKLLKLAVDIGIETRTVVSGIAKFYQPEDLPGQQVVLVANLAPRKLRGIESQGMILMAESPDGTLVFAQPGEDMQNGSVVR